MTLRHPDARTIACRASAQALFAPLLGRATETAMFAYLDASQRLLGLRHASSGQCDAMEFSIRDVVADALAFDAAAMVVAHNHPSGDPTPSAADRQATARLARALDPIGVRLIDHLVLADRGVTSFRTLGLL